MPYRTRDLLLGVLAEVLIIFGLLALAYGALNVVLMGARYERQAHEQRMHLTERLGMNLGFTECAETVSGEPVGLPYILTYVLNTEEEVPVALHEEVHARQIQRFKSCKAFNSYLRQPTNRLELEAEAFCVSALVWATQKGAPLSVGIERYVPTLATQYSAFSITLAYARERITHYCTNVQVTPAQP